jgi:hypothetical protein
VVALAACTTEYPYGTSAQSNFTYPDSTVTPIRNVTGSAKETVFGGTVFVTGKMKQDAIDSALAGTPNANVLLNYREDVKITTIMILPIFTVEYSVEGVAAEAEAK